MAKTSKGSDAFGWLEAPTKGGGGGDGSQVGQGEVPGASGEKRRTRNRAKTGKRSNPNYVLAGAYIDGRVRRRVDEALTDLREPGKKKTEYSDLVQGLLVRWLDEVGWPVEDEDLQKTNG